jgi:uncharacterized membrane protein YhaH (DUF805 family)
MQNFWIQQYFWTIVFCILLFYSARKMGYSGLLWLLVSILYWPLASLYLLAALPNRKLDKDRKKEMSLLKQQLAKRKYSVGNTSSIVPGHTISDERTTE